MYIGNKLRHRMELLKIGIQKLAEISFVDEEYIQSILDDRVSYYELDNFDLDLISSALHCKKEYFWDESVSGKDLLVSSYNRGFDNDKSIEVKAKLQDFLNDFSFLKQVKSGEI